MACLAIFKIPGRWRKFNPWPKNVKKSVLQFPCFPAGHFMLPESSCRTYKSPCRSRQKSITPNYSTEDHWGFAPDLLTYHERRMKSEKTETDKRRFSRQVLLSFCGGHVFQGPLLFKSATSLHFKRLLRPQERAVVLEIELDVSAMAFSNMTERLTATSSWGPRHADDRYAREPCSCSPLHPPLSWSPHHRLSKVGRGETKKECAVRFSFLSRSAFHRLSASPRRTKALLECAALFRFLTFPEKNHVVVARAWDRWLRSDRIVRVYSRDQLKTFSRFGRLAELRLEAWRPSANLTRGNLGKVGTDSAGRFHILVLFQSVKNLKLRFCMKIPFQQRMF